MQPAAMKWNRGLWRAKSVAITGAGQETFAADDTTALDAATDNDLRRRTSISSSQSHAVSAI